MRFEYFSPDVNMPSTYCAVATAHYVQNTLCSKIQYDADNAKNILLTKDTKNVKR